MGGPGPPKQRAAAAATAGACAVPDDALVEKFGLLPANSLHRFKCVSKAWCGLVTDPLHRQRYATRGAGEMAGAGAGRASLRLLPCGGVEAPLRRRGSSPVADRVLGEERVGVGRRERKEK
jgi:hypothetical protein